MSANTVVCSYRVRAGQEAAFEALLRRHWPTLREHGLVTDEPPRHFKGEERGGGPLYVEIFTWREGGASRAHELPAVASVWEPMATCCEARESGPAMAFPHVEPLEL